MIELTIKAKIYPINWAPGIRTSIFKPDNHYMIDSLSITVCTWVIHYQYFLTRISELTSVTVVGMVLSVLVPLQGPSVTSDRPELRSVPDKILT